LAQRLSQHELADAAGVTRQAVAGIEGGHWDPSLRVALALARALSTTVEELFSPLADLPGVEAAPLSAAEEAPKRVDLAQVGERMIALPLLGDHALRAGFTPTGGVVVGSSQAKPPRWKIRPTSQLRPTLVVAGCDPALPLLAGPLARLDPPVGLAWWPCGSRDALKLAAAGLVHVAGFHVDEDRKGAVPTALGRRFDAEGCEVISFAFWQEGLAFRPETPVSSLADVAQTGWRLVSREPGSEARELLERERARLGLAPSDLPGLDTTMGGHLLVASAIAAGLGHAGVTTEAAALTYGLGFLGMASERFLLALPRPLLSTAEVRALLRVLASPALKAQLASLPGYGGVESCGESVWSR
jgi:molybdate-binding protein/DNA-binding XRE family transcriptional regulator